MGLLSAPVFSEFCFLFKTIIPAQGTQYSRRIKIVSYQLIYFPSEIAILGRTSRAPRALAVPDLPPWTSPHRRTPSQTLGLSAPAPARQQQGWAPAPTALPAMRPAMLVLPAGPCPSQVSAWPHPQQGAWCPPPGRQNPVTSWRFLILWWGFGLFLVTVFTKA